jgi:hypothetical protein
VTYLMSMPSLDLMARSYYDGLHRLPPRHVYPKSLNVPEIESSGCSHNTSSVYGGTALACIEQTDICASDTGGCWNVGAGPCSAYREGQSRLQELESESILYLLNEVLRYSNMYSALPELLFTSSSLMHYPDRQMFGGIRDINSPALLCARWEKVARQLFETSLARIQIDMWDFARGTLAAGTSFEDELPPAYRGLCKMIKFKAVGWKNLNAFWAFTCLVLGLFCWVGSMEFNGKMVLVRSGERLCLWLNQLTRKAWELWCFTKNWFTDMVDRVFRN